MLVIEKIGYVTVIYWSYKFARILARKIYGFYFSKHMAVNLRSMGKWAIVTGCTNGVGRAYAEALAKLGMNLILISPEIEALNATSKEIESLYTVETRIVQLNLSEGLQSYTIIEKEICNLEVGVLINNLGMSYPHPEYFLDLPCSDRIYMNIIQRNTIVVTNMCRVVLPQMITRGRGVIVNVASMVAVFPTPLLTVFAASKAYVVKFSKDLQIEYAKHGIIVQCLLPGTITNQSTDSPKAGWMVPSPERYVASAIQTIGKESVTTGYFQHSLLICMVKFLYRIYPSFIVFLVINTFESNRNNALRRYVG